MVRNLERVTRLIRDRSRRPQVRRNRTRTWESNQWQNGIHRRDGWS